MAAMRPLEMARSRRPSWLLRGSWNQEVEVLRRADWQQRQREWHGGVIAFGGAAWVLIVKQ